MSHLLLHIGAAKTGTTAIQQWLGDHRKIFESEGIYVGWFQHPQMLACCFGFYPDSWHARRHGLIDLQSYQQHFSPIRSSLEQEMAMASRTFKLTVLSSEHMSFLLKPNEVTGLRNFFRRYYKKITIIHYSRDPISRFRASYSQAVRRDYSWTYTQFCREKITSNAIGDAEMLGIWEAIFGTSNCQFLAYDKSHFPAEDVRRDFFSRLPIRVSDIKIPFPAVSANPSLGALGAEAFRRVNLEFPYWDDQHPQNINQVNIYLKRCIEATIQSDQSLRSHWEEDILTTYQREKFDFHESRKWLAESLVRKATEKLRHSESSLDIATEDVTHLIKSAAKHLLVTNEKARLLEPDQVRQLDTLIQN